jgi:hypothetical protein
VCFTSALISRAGPVAGEHLSASPTGKAHQILFLSAIGQPPMREGVTEHVRVEMIQTSLLSAASQHLANAVVRHVAAAANPELGTAGKAMLAALAQVALDGLTGLVTEGTGTGSAPLPQHEGNVSIKINVCERKAGHLGQAHTGIEEQPNDGRVTSVFKIAAIHAAKQARELGLIQDSHWLLRDARWAEAGHRRCLDQLLGECPAIELLEAAKPHSGCGRLVTFELVSQELFDVAALEHEEITVGGMFR